MDTTQGFKRNHGAEEKAFLLGQLDHLKQRQEEVTAAIQAAIEAPDKMMYLVSVRSNTGGRHAKARGHKLGNALTGAIRRYANIYQLKVGPKDKVDVWAKFPEGVEVKLPKRLWRCYSNRAIKQLTR